ncbi:DUF2637 domain-containing protein [Barrientosiimonas humi]|uniref:DUF2637 domain-containing protein n=1 Tax=Barrientosiimonas humi TaxID=999931 RepID=UPI00370DA204
MSRWQGRRWAVLTSVAGTVFIAAGAFWLSFTALADLARRSGIGARQAWAWPLIVDGIIVTATVAVVALAGTRTAWYPWALLVGGAAVSVTANSLHAVVAADADVPGPLAAAVAAVPPVVLLAITHLTVVLTRATPTPDASEPAPEPSGLGLTLVRELPAPEPAPALAPAPAVETASVLAEVESAASGPETVGGVGDRRARAVELREAGWSNKKIARAVEVHPSTVGRWFAGAHQPDETATTTREPVTEGATP